MNLIESIPVRPAPLGMRALPIISYAASVFSDIIGADELWLLDPDPSLESFYMKEGFSSRTIYHGKRVGQRRIL
jgi:L-rhamnose isomerase